MTQWTAVKEKQTNMKINKNTKRSQFNIYPFKPFKNLYINSIKQPEIGVFRKWYWNIFFVVWLGDYFQLRSNIPLLWWKHQYSVYATNKEFSAMNKQVSKQYVVQSLPQLRVLVFLCDLSLMRKIDYSAFLYPWWPCTQCLCLSSRPSSENRSACLHQQPRALATAECERGLLRAEKTHSHTSTWQEAQQEWNPAFGCQVH